MTAIRASSLIARLRSRREAERIAFVAALGALASWLTYEIVFLVNPFEPRATISWLLAYCLGVLRQHHLDRLVSFPDPPVSYGTGLLRDYASSTVILALSTALNWIRTRDLRG